MTCPFIFLTMFLMPRVLIFITSNLLFYSFMVFPFLHLKTSLSVHDCEGILLVFFYKFCRFSFYFLVSDPSRIDFSDPLPIDVQS